MEKLKEQSYKNVYYWLTKYYQMLMAGQQQHQENYISPYNRRDNLIDTHINIQMNEGQAKAKQDEQERQRRITMMKDDYKHDLMNQIEEKMHLKNQEKMDKQK